MGALIGGIVGSVVGLILLIVLIVCLVRKCWQPVLPTPMGNAGNDGNSLTFISGTGNNPPPGTYPPGTYSPGAYPPGAYPIASGPNSATNIEKL